MEDWLVGLFEWMQTVAPIWVYLSLLVVAYIENVVPPIPGDIVIVFGGYLAGTGHVSFPIVVLLGTVGGLAGFMTMFGIGYRFGDAAMDPERLRWLPKRHIYRARQWLLRWGYLLVATNRFLTGLRSVISLTVGAAHMNPWRTTLFSLISAFLWTLLITYAGLMLGENWDRVSIYLSRYGTLILVVFLIFVAIQVVRYVWRTRR